MNFNEQYKVWTWKNSLYMLHWIVNPGLAFNEIILGQRVPKKMLVTNNPTKALLERSFILCPHCGKIHSGLKWTPQNKTIYGSWFGLYCDNCGKVIPCLRNATSFIIIVITSPIWIFFINSWKRKWLLKQKEKFSKPLKLSVPKYNVWLHGFRFAFVYFVLTMIFKYAIFNESFTWKKPVGSLIGAIIAGLLFATVMREIITKKNGPLIMLLKSGGINRFSIENNKIITLD